MIDVDSKEEARRILPPVFRPQAKITQLMKFKLEQIEEILRQHPG